ncbi:MAG: TPR end-of-group domain-containing protein [Planctomycetota bacterium]|jgi:tetratricopeptide (TPR) repeat protein
MNKLQSFVACLLATVFLASTVRAEEDEPPPFGASDVVIEADALPEGWTMLDEDVEGTPGTALESWALGVANGSGLDEDALYFETRILRRESGELATILVIEVEGDAQRFADALGNMASARGHALRRFGHPSRLFVVAAPEAIRPEVISLETTYAIGTLTRLAWERLQTGGRMAAIRYAEGAAAVDEAAGAPHTVLGLAAFGERDWDTAIAAFRKAFGRQAALRAEGRLALFGWGRFGQSLLMKQSAEVNAEARDALEKAVALEDVAKAGDPMYEWLYDLACAHNRLDETQKALDRLEQSFALAKQRAAQQVYVGLVQHAMRDPDLASLKENPRFKEIIRKATGGGSGHEGM